MGGEQILELLLECLVCCVPILHEWIFGNGNAVCRCGSGEFSGRELLSKWKCVAWSIHKYECCVASQMIYSLLIYSSTSRFSFVEFELHLFALDLLEHPTECLVWIIV